MQRTIGAIVLAGVVGLAACSPGGEVSDDTAVPNESTGESSADSDEASSAAASSSDEPPAIATSTVAPTAEGVALPGLIDTSDQPIEPDDDVRSGTLANGLTYYVRHNERPGAKAALRLAIEAGSVNETGPNTGVAHLVEHMLFNGTEQFPENELIDVLRGFGAAFGADVNAYTTFDETVYELDVPNDDESVETALTVLDEWLSHATFDPAQVEAERGVVLDEWRTSTQSVDGRLIEVAEDLYLTGSPYEGRDPIGTQESIENVPRDELKQFYDDWYRPDNAAVVVVGDIDVDDIVGQIEQRFGVAEPRTETMPDRPDTTFGIETVPDFALHSDPDQTTVDVEVDLPLPAFESDGTAALRVGLLDQMILQTLVRRLDQDVTAGTAAFDEIMPGTNSMVTSLDAPALYAVTDAERVDATLVALLDEYERADRYGFSDAEAETAKSTMQAMFDSLYDGRDTTQDVEFADTYVSNFLAGDPYPSIDDLYEVATAEIAAITPEALDLRFTARWQNSAPHVIISTPEAQAADMPTRDEVLAVIEGTSTREIAERDAGRELPDQLMEAPESVSPDSREELLDYDDPLFDPVEVVFPNGARVIVASNDIVDGQFVFTAASPGGSSLVADDDVIDALYTPQIVTDSGVGEFDQTELEQIISDRDVELYSAIAPYIDTFDGRGASSDLETLFQLINLYMSAPRFDAVALDQLRRLEGPTIDDPSSDPAYAGWDALLDARYGDELRYAVLPTPEQFDTLDLEGVERVWRQRFGDAGDWVFVFTGDVDVNELIELAGSYIATLPGDGSAEQWRDLDRPPPPGVVQSVVNAGTGDSATLTLNFSSPVDSVDGELRATLDVVTEVLNTRLTDVVREQLGESYSPSAYLEIASDPGSMVVTYIDVSGSPDRIDAVAGLVADELADLAANGPTEREFETSYAQVEEAYGFVDNYTFAEELINDAIWPDRELEDYIEEYFALPDVDAGAVQNFIADHVGIDQYIKVTVAPR